MHIKAFFNRPQTHYDRRNSLKRDAPDYHTETPDADNIAKFIGDALKGVAYQDDRFLYNVTILKQWSENASKTTVKLIYEK